MTARRTDFYLDKQNAKWLGVCSGIADYTGIDRTWVRVAAVVLTVMGGFPWTLIAYWVTAWVANPKPLGLYDSPEDAQFWQGVRRSMSRNLALTSRVLRAGDCRTPCQNLASSAFSYSPNGFGLATHAVTQ